MARDVGSRRFASELPPRRFNLSGDSNPTACARSMLPSVKQSPSFEGDPDRHRVMCTCRRSGLTALEACPRKHGAPHRVARDPKDVGVAASPRHRHHCHPRRRRHLLRRCHRPHHHHTTISSAVATCPLLYHPLYPRPRLCPRHRPRHRPRPALVKYCQYDRRRCHRRGSPPPSPLPSPLPITVDATNAGRRPFEDHW